MDKFALGFLKYVLDSKEYYLMHPIGVTHDDLKNVLVNLVPLVDEDKAQMEAQQAKLKEEQQAQPQEEEAAQPVIEAEVVNAEPCVGSCESSD